MRHWKAWQLVPHERVKVHMGILSMCFKFHSTQTMGNNMRRRMVFMCWEAQLGTTQQIIMVVWYGRWDYETDFFFLEKVVLFKCRWFDTSSRNEFRRLHPHFEIVEVNANSRLKVDMTLYSIRPEFNFPFSFWDVPISITHHFNRKSIYYFIQLFSYFITKGLPQAPIKFQVNFFMIFR